MADPMTDEQLAAIREREKAATPGPWLRRHYTDCLPLIKMPNDEIQDITRVEDADFIAEARTDVPSLLDEVERLKAAYATAIDALDELHCWQNGPPMPTPRYEKGWGEAMVKVEAVLAAAETAMAEESA